MSATKEKQARADAPKMTSKDRVTRLRDLRRRNKEMFTRIPDTILRNEFIKIGANVFDDEKFLLDEISRLTRLLGKAADPDADKPVDDPAGDDGRDEV
jgi:hypothetical protein